MHARIMAQEKTLCAPNTRHVLGCLMALNSIKPLDSSNHLVTLIHPLGIRTWICEELHTHFLTVKNRFNLRPWTIKREQT
jgi:hypothetical protein